MLPASALACAVALAALSAESAGGDVATAASAGEAGELRLKTIGDFVEPAYVAAAPDPDNRKLLFVVERRGTVKVIKDGELRRQPFLDIREQVAAEGEGGLLSIAFDPEYRKNRPFYAYFSDPRGDIRVSAYRRSKQSKLRAEPTGRGVLEIRHRDSAIHYDGTVSFGPDGYLYLATGDGGPACDPKERAQDPRSLLGKLLRIDPRPRGGYEIPADNPFVAAGDGTRGEIYAVGLRNPFRFSIDQRSETIAIGDVGQEDYEEINLLSLEQAAGANFGWDAFEASEGPPPSCITLDDASPEPARHDAPAYEYSSQAGAAVGACSVVGGVVVHNPKLVGLDGSYVSADFCAGDLQALTETPGGTLAASETGINVVNPISITSGRAGRLYMTSLAGGVYRIKAGDGRASRKDP